MKMIQFIREIVCVRGRLTLIAAVASLGICACSGGGDAEPSADADPPQGSGTPAAPTPSNADNSKDAAASPPGEADRSQHFAAVAQHLDLGGEVFAYLDIDGDVEALAGVAQGFLDLAEGEGGGLPPHIVALDLGKLMAKLGADGVEAAGISSVRVGEHYHNRAYIHVPEGREGLLKILGGGPQPFVANSLAPADSDLIMEQSVDARAAYSVATTMVADLGGPEALEQFNEMMGEAVAQLGLSLADLLRKLDTRITVVGRIHPDKPLELPDAPANIPSFDILVALDDMGWMFDKVTAQMKKDMPAEQQAQMFVSGDGFERIVLPPMPAPEAAVVTPVIQHDTASKRVLVASSQAFLDECLSGATSLADNAEFSSATEGLPTEGNGLSYVSARLSNAYGELMGTMMAADAGAGATETAIMTKMFDTMMPAVQGAQASVTTNLPGGVLMVSNASQSFKQSFVAAGTAALAMGAAIAVPAATMARERAEEAQQENLRHMREIEDQLRELERLENERGDDVAPPENE